MTKQQSYYSTQLSTHHFLSILTTYQDFLDIQGKLRSLVNIMPGGYRPTLEKAINSFSTFSYNFCVQDSSVNREILEYHVSLIEEIYPYFNVSRGNFAMKLYVKLYIISCSLSQVCKDLDL